MAVKKVFWVEQRYVFPVKAATFDEAEGIAFKHRAQIAQECGPVQSKPHRVQSMLGIREREGWDDSPPYEEADAPLKGVNDA
jgi:hypothetical protein